jgi:Xaa-Pro aminopeptidase
MKARVIVAASEHDANMLYATGMFVPDPFIYCEARGRSHIVLSDLEIDRGRRVAKVDKVHSYSQYVAKLKRAGLKTPRLADVLAWALREHGIRSAEVPSNFPLGLAQQVKSCRFTAKPDPFFPERQIKTAQEIRHIEDGLELAQMGMRAGINALQGAKVGRDGWLYWRGQKLTSDHVRGVIEATIAGMGGTVSNTIVAGGDQACDPHERGHGPLRANRPIILDVFPRDRSGYYGDITRTVVRGRASEAVKKLYATVAEGQQIAMRMIRKGVNGRDVHAAIQDHFTKNGYVTGVKNGTMQGFFHGTGHGLGLDIHEPIRVAPADTVLRAGNVVTVEPGLYYRGVGGVRIEDVVLVQARGVKVLSRFPKVLEL